MNARKAIARFQNKSRRFEPTRAKLLAVLGIAGMVGPGGFDLAVLSRDFPLMIGLAITLYLLARGLRMAGSGRINRVGGGLLLAVFVGYQLWLLVTSSPTLTA